ncbi:acyltransferase family protein [Paenarthrobacter sp. NEAU-H11]|uniref:acyltransferase family protein n=1 Tax=Paenarthrobacter sp. NEAU-H11 TaxID=3423924 RepID=UPI003D34B60F
MNKVAEGRLDFDFIDGMRAVAAVAVAVLHASLYTGHEGDIARELPYLHKVLFAGNYAVSVFIVLSGFVLALPIVRRRRLRIRKGTGSFLARRAKRILPPYFASLLLFGLLIAAIPVLQTRQGTAWDSKIPPTIDGLIAHVLVVHNLNKEWAYQINGPAWSIATEWQLYLALPLLILPLWRKIGPLAMLAVCLGLSAVVAVLLPTLDAGHLWFLALFAMGAIAAHIVANGVQCQYLGAATLVVLASAAGFVLIAPGPLWASELLTGAGITLGVVWMAKRRVAGKHSILHRVLESKPLVWLGLWSYSLYLIHSPLLGLGNLLTLHWPMSTLQRFAFMSLVVLPMSAGVAYLFHVSVERRFITQHQKKTEGATSLVVEDAVSKIR